jgi:hypothetical protein
LVAQKYGGMLKLNPDCSFFYMIFITPIFLSSSYPPAEKHILVSAYAIEENRAGVHNG